MVLQPNIEERRRILSQGEGDTGDTSAEAKLSDAGVVGIVIGTIVGGVVLVTAAVVVSGSLRNSSRRRPRTQRVAVSPASEEEGHIPPGPVVEQPGGNSSDAVESLYGDSA
eukprot:gb/GECG01012747.1/.p1 GENE.gb/GECG01012747.1/~~gb/GECG01012747.1/.p1  ORF type:complete len:111 (+),score=13.96 gb/GECG01012747.1/:1-333(+)